MKKSSVQYALVIHSQSNSKILGPTTIVWFTYPEQGWSGDAMVLGKLPVPGRLSNLDYNTARGLWVLFWSFFSLIYHFSLSLSLGDGLIWTVILSQWAVKPKPTNQPTGGVLLTPRVKAFAFCSSAHACDAHGGGNIFNFKRGSNPHNFSLSLFHRPDITEILLKRT